MLYALLIYAIFIFILLFGIKFRPLTKEEDFFFSFNRLRGFFALEIVVGHVVRYESSLLYPIGKFMIISVAFFFFVSAYGMARSYDAKEDYLHGFLTGLSNALRNKGRQVIELRLNDVSAFSVGMLIALYERAVAAYAELIHINAFHQPGVQAYKLASKGVIKLLTDLEGVFAEMAPVSGTSAELAAKANCSAQEYEVDGILAKLSANTEKRDNPIRVSRSWNPDKGWIYSIEKK